MLSRKDGCNGARGLQLERIRLRKVVGVFFFRGHMCLERNGNVKLAIKISNGKVMLLPIILAAVNKCN